MSLNLPCRHALFLLVATMLTISCTPLGLVNGLSPSGHYRLTSGISYGADDRQSLDIYTPHRTTTSMPMVVFFYGGGWRDGNKEDYEFVASSLTEAGYVVVIPDPRYN